MNGKQLSISNESWNIHNWLTIRMSMAQPICCYHMTFLFCGFSCFYHLYLFFVFRRPDEDIQDCDSSLHEDMDSKLPLQLAIVGRPNVGKSTLLNAILQENRVLVGPEAGLTRDSIRVHFEYDGRDVYLVSIIFVQFKVTATLVPIS